MPEFKYIEDGVEYECAKIGAVIFPIKPLQPEEPSHELDIAFLAATESANKFLLADNRNWLGMAGLLAIMLCAHVALYRAMDDGIPIALIALGIAEAMMAKAIWGLLIDWRIRRLAKLFSAFAQKIMLIEIMTPSDKRITAAKRLALCTQDAAITEIKRLAGVPPRQQG